MSSVYKCSICFCTYNNTTSEPICLPCGHSYCRPCVCSLCHPLISGNCPIDNKEFFYIEDLLPINYSLINNREDTCSRICSIHNFTIIGYCIEHSTLLCGKCIFLHKNHNFCDITSNQTDEIIEKKLKNLKNIENQLNDLLLS